VAQAEAERDETLDLIGCDVDPEHAVYIEGKCLECGLRFIGIHNDDRLPDDWKPSAEPTSEGGGDTEESDG
jgi:hypothetical protein